MRSPQDIVMTIAYAIKEGKKGDKYAVADLAKKMQMHYMTTNDYLDIIEYVQNSIPIINKTSKDGNAGIIIVEELKIKFSKEEKMLLDMFDSGAFTAKASVTARPFDNECVQSALKKRLIKEINKKYYLTTEGIIEAADQAEKRAEKVIDFDKENRTYNKVTIETGEWIIEDDYNNPDQNHDKITVLECRKPQSVVPTAA